VTRSGNLNQWSSRSNGVIRRGWASGRDGWSPGHGTSGGHQRRRAYLALSFPAQTNQIFNFIPALPVLPLTSCATLMKCGGSEANFFYSQICVCLPMAPETSAIPLHSVTKILRFPNCNDLKLGT